MKVHVVPQPNADLLGFPAVQAIQVVDLWGQAEHRSLWRDRGASKAAAGPVIGLPAGGFPSSMGFWLAALPDAALIEPGSLTLTIRSPVALAAGGESAVAMVSKPGGRPPQTVRVKGQSSAEGDLLLTIGPAGAVVVASEAAWQNLAEGVLLAACQYWRFCQVETQIDRLTDLAHSDLDHAAMATARSLRQSRRLIATAKDVRALLVDLPHVEGPLTNALAYCSTARAAEVYESLSEKLELEDWCELIDERVEAVEDTYEAVTEKLLELRHFAWEAVLEVLIIVILLGELVLALFEYFA